jgi:hypothetical protein
VTPATPEERAAVAAKAAPKPAAKKPAVKKKKPAAAAKKPAEKKPAPRKADTERKAFGEIGKAAKGGKRKV